MRCPKCKHKFETCWYCGEPIAEEDQKARRGDPEAPWHIKRQERYWMLIHIVRLVVVATAMLLEALAISILLDCSFVAAVATMALVTAAYCTPWVSGPAQKVHELKQQWKEQKRQDKQIPM